MIVLNFDDLKDFNFPQTAVALGSFEALHLGHLRIIETTVECAKKNNIKSMITIFREPVLKDKCFVCETLEERLNILSKTGIDIVVIFDFNEEFKSIEYTDFFKKYLVEKFKVSHIFTGFNYRFGYKAKGNTDNLLCLCKENNIYLNITPPVSAVNEIISSTYIHKLIEKGAVEILIKVLLRPYSITGTVTSGRKIGTKLGFPTANVIFPDNKAIIKNGVYFGIAKVKNKKYFSLINVGPQPTVTNKFTPRIEAHLFDFKGNLYESKIKLSFLVRIRDIQKFSDINELIKQLQKDKIKAQEIIKANTF